jgi:ADP-heptose:LPS heptosyltransferase
MKPAAEVQALTRAARRVLVIDPGMLGDAVHLVPALWVLRHNYPAAELHVVSSPVGFEVLQLAGCVDRQWVLEQAGERRRLAPQLRTLWALRRLRFDLSINFGDNDRNLIHAGLIGARCRLGRRAGRWHFWSAWCLGHWACIPDPAAPAFEQRRQVLAAAGLTLAPPRFALEVTPAAARRAAALVAAGAIHLSINASHPLKEWPLEHWTALAHRLVAAAPALHLVATGSANPREQERLRAFAASVHSDRLTLPPPGLPIGELAAVLQRCRLHVGADSGVLHLAAAVGTPTLSLFREYADARAWMPVGSAHRVLSVACRCVNQTDPPCQAAGRAECLAGIAVERVLSASLEASFPL